jgi:cellulose biosynthesis protein BcsQ
MSATGRIITFYSYKGGGGRSMAVANVAWILASSGRRVLLIDWDLDAPGLHHFFRPFLTDPQLVQSDGLIDFLFTYLVRAAGESSASGLNIFNYACSLNWEFPSPGAIDFVPAGRQNPSYAVRVNEFDWQTFYERLAGHDLLESLKCEVRSMYDYVLIDSRSGVSDYAGICTIQMPDALVIPFTLNHQSLDGAATVAASVMDQRNGASPPLPISIYPVPMRIDSAEKEMLDHARQYAWLRFQPITDAMGLTWEYWRQVEFPYTPYYSYSEVLAAFVDLPFSTGSILRAAESLTAHLTNGEVTAAGPIREEKRQRISEAYLQRGRRTSTSQQSSESL